MTAIAAHCVVSQLLFGSPSSLHQLCTVIMHCQESCGTVCWHLHFSKETPGQSAVAMQARMDAAQEQWERLQQLTAQGIANGMACYTLCQVCCFCWPWASALQLSNRRLKL